MAVTDPLSDCQALLIQHGLNPDLCARIITQVRQRWGGSQVYIPAHDRPARDRAIATAIADGLPVREVAARAQVSVSTVKRRRSEWYR